MTNDSGQSAGFTAESLRGVFVPFTTPFDGDEEVDFEGLSGNLACLASIDGLSGLVALGSTGERLHLSHREAVEQVNLAREVLGRSKWLIAGAGQQSTRGTIEEIREYVDAGADAVLVSVPSYYRRAITQPVLEEFFTNVADANDVPVILYNMPDLTGIAIAPETVAHLAKHPRIVGLKDSSAEIVSLMRTIELIPGNFAIAGGNGPAFFAALNAGIDGAILAVGCVVPEIVVKIFRLFREGHVAEAQSLHRDLVPLARAVTSGYGIGGLKSAIDMVGFYGGAVRRPLNLPDENARREIAKALSNFTSRIAAPVAIA